MRENFDSWLLSAAKFDHIYIACRKFLQRDVQENKGIFIASEMSVHVGHTQTTPARMCLVFTAQLGIRQHTFCDAMPIGTAFRFDIGKRCCKGSQPLVTDRYVIDEVIVVRALQNKQPFAAWGTTKKLYLSVEG
tara:strand:- start:17 stop:418 length:402 start_codon:yes stop_codon:yes gene_type:complete